MVKGNESLHSGEAMIPPHARELEPLRDLITEYKGKVDSMKRLGSEPQWKAGEFDSYRVMESCYKRLEALLPALESAIREGEPRVLTGKRLEETVRAYCGRDMTEGIDWSSIAARLNADSAPTQPGELGNLKTVR